jgi:hypothetical protein
MDSGPSSRHLFKLISKKIIKGEFASNHLGYVEKSKNNR